MQKENSTTEELIKYFDVVVDGKFEIDKTSPKLRFRGSYNQKILDAKETIKEDTPVEIPRLYEKERIISKEVK